METLLSALKLVDRNSYGDPLRRVSKLLLARWRPQPIKIRVLEHQPSTERLQSISLKTPLSENCMARTHGFIKLWEQKNWLKLKQKHHTEMLLTLVKKFALLKLWRLCIKLSGKVHYYFSAYSPADSANWVQKFSEYLSLGESRPYKVGKVDVFLDRPFSVYWTVHFLSVKTVYFRFIGPSTYFIFGPSTFTRDRALSPRP